MNAFRKIDLNRGRSRHSAVRGASSLLRALGCALLCFSIATASAAASVPAAAVAGGISGVTGTGEGVLTVASSSSLKISGASHPSTLRQGQVFNVRGTVSSNHRIKKVTVEIRDSKNRLVSGHTVYPYSYSYNLANLDYYILFNKAKPGKNYYKITAWDTKKKVKKKWSFKVKSSSSGSSSGSRKSDFLGYATYHGVNYRQQTRDSRRIAALDKAKKMATIKWKCSTTFPAWYNYEGYYSRVTATDGSSSTKFKKGKTYVGIPYSMVNHSYDDNAWASVVRNGYSYNQMAASYYSNVNKTTAKGSDCSYFVYLCMRAGGASVSYQTTYMMYNNQYYRKISKSALKPGDILLTNSHVRLYAGKVGNMFAMFEASGSGSKTRYKLFSKSELKSYSAYRYKKW